MPLWHIALRILPNPDLDANPPDFGGWAINAGKQYQLDQIYNGVPVDFNSFQLRTFRRSNPAFIWTMPPERAREWREAITPPETVAKYVSLFADLHALTSQIDAETGRREPVLLRWTPAAKARFVDFVNAHGKEMRAFKSDRLKSAWSKLEGQGARLALVFHCVRHTFLPGPDGEARHADMLIQFARRNGGQCTARDAARVGAGGRSS